MNGIIIQSDALHIPLSDDSVDMVMTSPPYLDARWYLEDGKKIGADRKCEAWIEWMLDVVKELLRVCKGAVIVNCAGKTKDRNYQPGPEGLLYRAWQAGIHSYRPCQWYRVGIPGSGGKTKCKQHQEWYRADTEYVFCFKRPGPLPWAMAEINGHPPKWAPGGEMSHRLGDGRRVNQWGGSYQPDSRTNAKNANGERTRKYRPSHKYNAFGVRTDIPIGTRGSGNKGEHEMYRAKMQTRRKPNGERALDGDYLPPVLANPGNLVSFTLGIETLFRLVEHYGNATKKRPDQVLRDVQHAIVEGAISRWFIGVVLRLCSEEVLRPEVYGTELRDTDDEKLSALWEVFSATQSPDEVLLDGLRREGEAHSAADSDSSRNWEGEGKENNGGHIVLRDLWLHKPTANSPQRRESNKQSNRESSATVPTVPPEGPREAAGEVLFVRESGEAIQSLRDALRQALPQIQEAWRSVEGLFEQAISECGEGSSLIKCKVGGGLMGHKLAHENEAPMPIGLATYFIRSHCPPGGIVLDPFSGSGTTAHAANRLGRRFVAADLRMSQCRLAQERMNDVTRQRMLFVGAE